MSNLPTLLKIGNLIPRMDEDDKDLVKLRPIDYILDTIDDSYVKTSNLTLSDRLFILLSRTGSGKSTILPVQLYKKYKKKVLVTQPRVITTIEIVKDIVAREKDLTLYSTIGYQTKEYIRKPQQKGILFSTLGILLQYLKHIDYAIMARMFKFILIDEVHDTSIDRDLTLFYIKKLTENVSIDQLPFIIFMSATLDVNELSTYFNTKSIFEVSGKTYPIEQIYREPKENYSSEIIKILKEINNSKSGDIIIFCSSMNMINKLDLKIKDAKIKDILTIPLDSKVYRQVGKEYQNLVDKSNKVKVILTTNVAETGLTLPDLKYCIDIGYFTSVTYCPINDSTIIIPKPIDQSSATQRTGRVGRTKPGICYRIYSEDTFNAMDSKQIPEINKINPDSFILSIINDKGLDLNLINKPSFAAIRNSLNKLFILDFISIDKTTQNIKLTKLGTLAKLLFKVPLEHTKLILSGFYFEVNILDLILIVSIIYNRYSTTYTYNNVNCSFINSLLSIYKLLEIEDKSARKKFCSDYNIDYKNVKSVLTYKYDLIKQCMFTLNLDLYKFQHINILELIQYSFDFNEYITKLKSCIYEGFKLNVLTKKNDMYYNRFNDYIKVKSKHDSNVILYNSIVNNECKDYICELDNSIDIDVTFLIS